MSICVENITANNFSSILLCLLSVSHLFSLQLWHTDVTESALKHIYRLKKCDIRTSRGLP